MSVRAIKMGLRATYRVCKRVACVSGVCECGECVCAVQVDAGPPTECVCMMSVMSVISMCAIKMISGPHTECV